MFAPLMRLVWDFVVVLDEDEEVAVSLAARHTFLERRRVYHQVLLANPTVPVSPLVDSETQYHRTSYPSELGIAFDWGFLTSGMTTLQKQLYLRGQLDRLGLSGHYRSIVCQIFWKLYPNAFCRMIFVSDDVLEALH